MAKILIVDDQRNMRTTLSMMLRGATYEVDEAADGEQGAERGATGAYDVVLTDLRMGTKDGIDVLRSTKDAHPLTEVIVMTAHGHVDSAIEAMKRGAYDFVTKPFATGELRATVQKALERRAIVSENERLRLLGLLLHAAIERLEVVERAQTRARSNGKVRLG